ncbi:MAG: hypothetical protein ACNYPI_10585 [Arenicellales bacterium WSBS_2016_MAG_OTU3]
MIEDGADHVVVKSDSGDGEFFIEHGLSIKEGAKAWVAIRPEKIRLLETPPAGTHRIINSKASFMTLVTSSSSTYRIKAASNTIVEVTYLILFTTRWPTYCGLG